MSLLNEEGAVVRKKEHTDERFTWISVTKPLLGIAADTVLHSLVLWCCTVVEPKGLIGGSLASLQSQWVTFLCPLVLLNGWIFKLKHKWTMQLHSVPLGQVLTCHICLSYCQALHLLGLILSQAGHCPQSIPVSIVVLGRHESGVVWAQGQLKKITWGLSPVFCHHCPHLVQFLYKNEEWEFEKSF